MAMQYAAEAGIIQRIATSEEIVERCVYALINEGARILEDGIALRSVDIDIVYLNGYGFPSWRGGPMKFADMTGLGKVYEKVCQFQERFGEDWTPAPLLERLSNQNSTFGAHDKAKRASA
jgi:3-hydroxyacyl-CoA dehydrogenase